MTEIIGNIGLCLAMLAACVGVLLALTGILRAARICITVIAAMLGLASAALIAALINGDFRIEYVAHYTERALPLGYKLAAFWAGQEGSLLLWALLLAAMSVVFVITRRRDPSEQAAASLAALACVLLFFAALMLFAANPFKTNAEIPDDGHGLNPMLQDPGMIAHPPLLFLGYAGYTFPFVMLIGALVAGRRDADWLAAVRPWAIISWLFLSIGILLGAQWAYVELGWGGYWAWDPVENASLLPWLTGTALLHSIMVQQHRGMFKKWNAMLIAATFVLCVFGTYLTRSGVIQSVHAFEKSLIGTFFLVFLAVLIVISAALIFARRTRLTSEHQLEGLLGREGMFLATNVLLVGMTLLTLVGTVFPLISRSISGQEVTVSAAFYNKVVAPLGLLLVALMALGPMLTYGPQAAGRLARASMIPAIGSIGSIAFLLGQDVRNPWALVCGAIVGFAILAIGGDFGRTLRHRRATTHESLPSAIIHLLDSNHRRYGGQLTHLGMLMIIVGVVGSSLFSINQTHQLTPGQSVTVGGRKIEFVKIEEVRNLNFSAVQADIRLTEADGSVTALHPQRRFYDKSEQPNAEVAIQSSWRDDVYLNLSGWENGGGEGKPFTTMAAIQVIVNPLVGLLWTGGIVLAVGGVVCLTPRLFGHQKLIEAVSKRGVPDRKGRPARREPVTA